MKYLLEYAMIGLAQISLANWIAIVSVLAAWTALVLSILNTNYIRKKDKLKLVAVAEILSRTFDQNDIRNISNEQITVSIQNKGRVVEIESVTFFPWEMALVGVDFKNEFKKHKLEPNHSITATIQSRIIRELQHPLLFRKLTVRLSEGRCVAIKVKKFKECCKEIDALDEDEVFDGLFLLTGQENLMTGCEKKKQLPSLWTRLRDMAPSNK